MEELYFAALDCEEEPRKKKKGDIFCGQDASLKASNMPAEKDVSSSQPQPTTGTEPVLSGHTKLDMKNSTIEESKEIIEEDTEKVAGEDALHLSSSSEVA